MACFLDPTLKMSPSHIFLAKQDNLDEIEKSFHGIGNDKETVALLVNKPTLDTTNLVIDVLRKGYYHFHVDSLYDAIDALICRSSYDTICPTDELKKAFESRTLTAKQLREIERNSAPYFPDSYMMYGRLCTQYKDDFFLVEQMEKVEYHLPSKVEDYARVKRLQASISPTLISDVKTMMNKEGKGFLGYHAATPDAWAFHTVIDLTVRFILNFRLEGNFFFARSPTEADDYREWTKETVMISGSYIGPRGFQANQVLMCLNYTLFNSYKGSSSLKWFYGVQNVDLEDTLFLNNLRHFYDAAGLNPHVAEVLFKMAAKIGENHCCLVQYFEKQRPYKEEFCEAHKVSLNASDGDTTLIEAGEPHFGKASEITDPDYQFRMFIHQVTPRHFTANIYCDVDPLSAVALAQLVKAAAPRAVQDPAKLEAYRVTLSHQWGLPIRSRL